MSFWLMALHLLNFMALPLGLALLLTLGELFFKQKLAFWHDGIAVAAMYFLTCLGVMLLGLALLGRDGKVLTYGTLVVVVGSLAAWRHR